MLNKDKTPRSHLSAAVIMPTYKSKSLVLDVIGRIGPQIGKIYVVDDFCPQQSGQYVMDNCVDSRVEVIFHTENRGVGGAVMTGYRRAIEAEYDVLIKIDSDGQMDPELIPLFLEPILNGSADYTKGNRFFNLEDVKDMPVSRIFGNSALSFASKLSTGYWNMFDPTNGYTAITAKIAQTLPFDKISKRFFFESDMLFRLNLQRAVVQDIPMRAVYGLEKSNLVIRNIAFEFLNKNFRNFLKRIFYTYFLRGMSAASIELVFGVILMVFGITFGLSHWGDSMATGTETAPGTVMVTGLSILSGLNLLIAFISFDVQNSPRR